MSEMESGGGAYVEISLATPRDACDAVCDYIIQNLATGMVLKDEEGSSQTVIKFYVPEANGPEGVAGLEAFLASRSDELPDQPKVTSRPVRNVEWEEAYRQSVESALVAPDVQIRPPWDESPSDARYQIIIEPKMAFGTGRHETTRSCLHVIARQFEQKARVLDLGCGSGILSILSDQMGASYIKAIDNDPIAIENCEENFRVNEVKAPFEVALGSIEKCDGDEPYDFVLVNIIKETILPMLPRLAELRRAGGKLLLAGLLAKDEEEISSALRETGLGEFEILRDNEWITYTVTGS